MSGVSGAEVRVGGTKLDDSVGQRLVEARIQENLRLPDACLLRFSEPNLATIDQFPIQIGSEIEVLLSAIDGTSLTSTFKGKVVSLEPEFAAGTILGFRAYDGSHQLHQSKIAATYQNMTAADIARKVGQRAGIDEGTIDSSGPPYDFIQQNNETDWEFLWKLAARIDFEVLVIDHKLYFRQAGPPAGTQDIELKWGDNLISFRPRISGVQQVDQVTVRARNRQQTTPFESTTSLQEPDSAIGISRATAAAALSGGTMVVADRPVHTQAEAGDLADAYASHMAAGYLEAEGVAKGNPAIKAGSKVKVDGIGTSFGGTYVVSSCTHLFQGTHGYRTLFSTSGRSARSLVDLMTPKSKRGWGNSVVMGLVTNNNDPENTGRVRVKYPALGDQTEGWWAPVVAPNAGASRGLLMLPQVGDEVVIGFEHDDVQHPYVLGSIWNGAATPGSDLALQDGSFSLQSDQKIQMHAKDVITIKSDKDFSLETTGKIDQKPQQDMTLDGAQSVTIKGGTSISIEGTTQLEIKCGSSSLTMNSMGVISISGTQISLG
jgi:phage protein D